MVDVMHLGGGVGKRGGSLLLDTSEGEYSDYYFVAGIVEVPNPRGGVTPVLIFTRRLLSERAEEPLPLAQFHLMVKLSPFAELVNRHMPSYPVNDDEHGAIIRHVIAQARMA